MIENTHGWLGHILESAEIYALTGRLRALTPEKRTVVQHVRGSAGALLAGAVQCKAQRPVLVVVAHLDDADDVLDDLSLFSLQGQTIRAQRFAAMEVLPGESNVSVELLAERLNVVRELAQGDQPTVLVASVQALMQSVPSPDTLTRFCLDLLPEMRMSQGELIRWLDQAGYQRVDAVEHPGDFSVRGGIIDLYPPATLNDENERDSGAYRVDFFGDEIDTLHRINLDTLGSDQEVKSIRLVGAALDQLQSDPHSVNLLNLLHEQTVVLLHEPLELGEQARGYYERLTNPRGIFAPQHVFKKLTSFDHVEMHLFAPQSDREDVITLPIEPLVNFAADSKQAIGELLALAEDPKQQVHVICHQPAEAGRLAELLRDHAGNNAHGVQMHLGFLHRGFIWQCDPADDEQDTLVLVPHHELFHRYQTRRRVRKLTANANGQPGEAFLDLSVGDYVVHVDHGIARFTGLQMMRKQGKSQEFLTLEFAQKALLHVPATQMDLIQKYIGGFQGKPPLSQLGGKRWSNTKKSVEEAVKQMAKRLLQIHAVRETQPGITYPNDTHWQHAFEAEFPYEETQDQIAAIDAVKKDMMQHRPMDRLVCGDVGFGKTEVAIRAAFKAVEYGKQVAVLVPTTVLAEQHERTFKARMADYPFRIASLSRFKTASEQKQILKELSLGQVDILIGTHRILSKDVRFGDLGLVVIDEEQRFGVEHKSKLLELRLTADVLTMTATPIPRTLHMSMVGLRDISSLTTPPMDRRAVVTEVIPYQNKRIKQAIVRELNRDGQIFFVHNRVHNIHTIANDLRALVPEARVLVGHGQMSPRELEKVMLKFMRHEADILVSTTIIESGIDIPTANTMFINQADHFGLAELHQLRGRVGRYKHRAYCYLLLPQDRPINEVAARRLKAIEQYAMLGAGFKIAMRDLEIRGAGNLLGSEQSGHIAAVGYEMYCLMLEQETKRLKNEPIIEPVNTHLELGIAPSLPKRYIPSDKHRMDVYRRLSRADSQEVLQELLKDMTEAYGKPPEAVEQYIAWTQIRIAASHLHISTIKIEAPDVIFKTTQPQKLMAILTKTPGRATHLDAQTVYWRPPANYLTPIETLLAVLRKLLQV